jgi:hypothetical protein
MAGFCSTDGKYILRLILRLGWLSDASEVKLCIHLGWTTKMQTVLFTFLPEIDNVLLAVSILLDWEFLWDR